MPNITKEELQRRLDESYSRGLADGVWKGYQTCMEDSKKKAPEREAAVRLINAVGQTLDTQARLVQGLASVLDNAPR